MVVGAPACDALGRPAADVAVVDRFGVGVGRRVDRGDLVRHRPDESIAGGAVVGHVVVDAEALDRSGAAAEGDVQPLRPDALDGLEQVDVGADLEHGAGLDVPRQLRVGDLVVVRTETGRPGRVVDPQQEVRVASPGPVEERRLVDDVGAGGHRRDRFGRGGAELVAAVLDRAVELDRDRAPTLRHEVGEEALLVLESALPDDVELRVVPHRALHEPGQRGPLELRQVLAREVGDEISGRVDLAAVDRLHASTIPTNRVR